MVNTAIATLMPEPPDTKLAESARNSLDTALNVGDFIRIRVGTPGNEVELPRPALTALAEVLDSFARGDGVTVIPNRAELTTQQAADALNVSRPFLIGLLDSGQIEYRTVGRHRRIRAASLVHYLQEDDARRRVAADALAAEAHALGLS